MFSRQTSSDGVIHLLALRDTAVKLAPTADDKENIDPNKNEESVQEKTAVHLVRRKRTKRASAFSTPDNGGRPAGAGDAAGGDAAAANRGSSKMMRAEGEVEVTRSLPPPLDALGRRVNLKLRSRTAVVNRQPNVKSALSYTF